MANSVVVQTESPFIDGLKSNMLGAEAGNKSCGMMHRAQTTAAIGASGGGCVAD